MGAFSSSAFAVVAFSVAAFAFDTTTPPEPPPPTFASVGGGFGSHFQENVDLRKQAERARRKRMENEAVVMAIVQFVLEQS